MYTFLLTALLYTSNKITEQIFILLFSKKIVLTFEPSGTFSDYEYRN